MEEIIKWGTCYFVFWSFLTESTTHNLCHWQEKIALESSVYQAVLRNRNYFFQFRFRFLLLSSSSSGSYFWQVTVPVPAQYLDYKKHSFQIFFTNLVFLNNNKLFNKEKIVSLIKFIVKCEWKKW